MKGQCDTVPNLLVQTYQGMGEGFVLVSPGTSEPRIF